MCRIAIADVWESSLTLLAWVLPTVCALLLE